MNRDESRGRRIQPRILRGFRDLTPELMLRKEAMLDTVRSVLRDYGFMPIDTPALEYAEILLAKTGGETEKQVYRFTDQGGRDVALRFDLTVPLARFAAMHVQQYGTPFKSYHLGPVWRGEKSARGRFREFWQCDFDAIGSVSPLADLETALVIHALLARLDLGAFTLRISDRVFLSALLARLGLADRLLTVLRAVDKLPRIGREGVARELREGAGLEPAASAAVFALIELAGEPAAVLEEVRAQLGDDPHARPGIERLALIHRGLAAAGVPAAEVRYDLAIARGLDYYTGTIFETFLDDEPELGSVCSGGRYDDLASLYSSRQLPGVGASLGLDRLLDAGAQQQAGGGASAPARASAQVLVLVLEPALGVEAARMAEELRGAGIATELYLDDRKIQKQLQYANRRGIRTAVIGGPEEVAAGVVSVKNLDTGTQVDGIARADLVANVRRILAGEG